LRFVVSSSCLGQSPTTDFPILELGDGRHLGDLHWNLVATEPLSAPLSDGAIGNRLIGDELQSNLLVAERVGSLKDHCVSYAGHLKDDLFDLGWIDLETRNVDHIVQTGDEVQVFSLKISQVTGVKDAAIGDLDNDFPRFNHACPRGQFDVGKRDTEIVC